MQHALKMISQKHQWFFRINFAGAVAFLYRPHPEATHLHVKGGSLTGKSASIVSLDMAVFQK